ncbi:MAG TPA: heavy metal translocating P-type ATPase [Casimicrobiaceae bacterium]|nr:heavy metal translocating P-type ATPase [Casimicrobiaceae bacterium]
MSDAANACWHCGEVLPADPPLARVDGVAHRVCCQGCRAAAEWIGTLGLADYYRLRNANAERPRSAAEAARDADALARPALARHAVRTRADGLAEVVVLVDGIRCTACTWLVERALSAEPGVASVSVNGAARRARIAFDAATTSLAAIAAAFARIGLTALPLDAAALEDAARRESREAMKRLAVSGFGAMQAMMFASALWFGALDGLDATSRELFRWLAFATATPVVLYAATPFFAGALRLARARSLGMDIPVALAVALAYAGSVVELVTHGPEVWFESVAMFVFFLSVGRYLEMRARHRAGDETAALARAMPMFADRVDAGGSVARVGARELAPGDRVVVAAGAGVPADGVLEADAVAVDESLVSGESTPVTRRRGETLLTGSIVDAPATIRVTRAGDTTVLASIVALAARAASERPRIAVAGERAAAQFVARVLVLAFATAIGWCLVDPAHAFAATVAVLVVSCPCAFALAAPAAVTRALGVLAARGVLVVHPDALARLAAASDAMLDKTGTLTEPRVDAAGVTLFGDDHGRHGDRDAAIAVAAALAGASAHPLARAFAALQPSPRTVSGALVTPGAGVSGIVDGRAFRLGRADFALALDDACVAALADAVVLADDAGPVAAFRLGERMKDGAHEAIDDLRDEGLVVTIVSGDAAARVETAAARLGVAQWRAGAKPADKLAWLAAARARGASVVAVGDGINDAPVLAGADVGVALASGASIAQARADIVLARDDLRALMPARRIARSMLAILRQNQRWALGYNLVAVPLAALGFVPPWLAALGMSASSLAVVLNALRIGRAEEPARARPTPSPVDSRNETVPIGRAPARPAVGSGA